MSFKQLTDEDRQMNRNTRNYCFPWRCTYLSARANNRDKMTDNGLKNVKDKRWIEASSRMSTKNVKFSKPKRINEIAVESKWQVHFVHFIHEDSTIFGNFPVSLQNATWQLQQFVRKSSWMLHTHSYTDSHTSRLNENPEILSEGDVNVTRLPFLSTVAST